MGTWTGSILPPQTSLAGPWDTIASWTGTWPRTGACRSTPRKRTRCQLGTGATVATATNPGFNTVATLHAGGLAIASEQWAHSAGKSIIKTLFFVLLFSVKYFTYQAIDIVDIGTHQKTKNLTMKWPLLNPGRSLKLFCLYFFCWSIGA